MKVTIEFPVDENFADKTNTIHAIGIEYKCEWISQGVDYRTNMRDIYYEVDKKVVEDFIKEINKIENVKVKTK
jgi:hypothetical protein